MVAMKTNGALKHSQTPPIFTSIIRTRTLEDHDNAQGAGNDQLKNRSCDLKDYSKDIKNGGTVCSVTNRSKK